MRATERKELLQRIIELCESVNKEGLNPFDVQVKEFFDRLRELLPLLKKYEEIYLDLKAVLGLSEVIKQQEEWVKHRSSLLYLDPLLVLLKIYSLSQEELAEVFVRAWHPILELECLTQDGLREGKEYWTNLPSLNERRIELEQAEIQLGKMGREEFRTTGLLRERFEEMLERLYLELKKRGKVLYWEFIRGKNFSETVMRAYLLSFLVTYGYVSLQQDPIKEEIWIEALDKPSRRKEVYSLPIAIAE